MQVSAKARWLKSVLYRNALRARGEGVEFLLCAEDIKLPDECPLLRIPLVYGSMAFDGAMLVRRDRNRAWFRDNTVVMSRSAYGMLMNKTTVMDNLPPFDFLSEAARRELWAEVKRKRWIIRKVEEFNKAFPADDSLPEYPSWLSTQADPEDPVERLRRELNSTLK